MSSSRRLLGPEAGVRQVIATPTMVEVRILPVGYVRIVFTSLGLDGFHNSIFQKLAGIVVTCGLLDGELAEVMKLGLPTRYSINLADWFRFRCPQSSRCLRLSGQLSYRPHTYTGTVRIYL